MEVKIGKVSPTSIKYIIHAKFTAEGVVEKPDVIGAVFGQTEGLLGEELELRELQKKGKIGRIDANCEVKESKTDGTVEIPTSVDKSETTIIAAAVETIDRIGPCLAKFEVVSIEDVRSVKREYVMERARKLLELLNSSTPTMREMQQDVLTKTRTGRLVAYGPELLPAGPDVETSEEIIIVEGRADVINLLKCGIKNAIAMNGTMIPDSLKGLSKQKKVTLFIDGDRGGILIAKNVINNLNIQDIARAPDGKEVEELTDKEAIICLRNKMPVDDFFRKNRIRKTGEPEFDDEDRPKRKVKKKKSETEGEEETGETEEGEKPETEEREEFYDSEPAQETDEEREFFREALGDLTGTRGAALIVKTPDGLRNIYKASSAKIIDSLYNFRRKHSYLYALVIDGTATAPIIKTAERLHCKFLIARNFANLKTNIKLISL